MRNTIKTSVTLFAIFAISISLRPPAANGQGFFGPAVGRAMFGRSMAPMFGRTALSRSAFGRSALGRSTLSRTTMGRTTLGRTTAGPRIGTGTAGRTTMGAKIPARTTMGNRLPGKTTIRQGPPARTTMATRVPSRTTLNRTSSNLSRPKNSTPVRLSANKSASRSTPNRVKATGDKRYTWRQSEQQVQSALSKNRGRVTSPKQRSFLNQKSVSNGKKGSTRPDVYQTAGKKSYSFEVKNYKVTTSSGRSNLVNNVSKQARHRAKNLPNGTRQQVVIDVRGQKVSTSQIRHMKAGIVRKSGLKPRQVSFLKRLKVD